MRSSDIITEFILEMLESAGGEFELKRNELAQHFNVVPSQINYVIASRFTPEMGFLTESKRGGGGYIKIKRVKHSPTIGIMHIINNIGESLNSFDAQAILKSMEQNGYIDEIVRSVMSAAVSDAAYSSVPPIVRDRLRAAIIKNMLLSIIVK